MKPPAPGDQDVTLSWQLAEAGHHLLRWICFYTCCCFGSENKAPQPGIGADATFTAVQVRLFTFYV